MKAVVLAGGTGERFWPLSTPETPKQLLKLFSEKTLLRETFERLACVLSPTDIIIVTGEKYANATYRELPECPKENILLEPKRKNTAAACVLGTLTAEDNEAVLVVPADHYIPNVEDFWNTVKVGLSFLETNAGLITFGIRPGRPETGYGYIELDVEVSPGIFRAKRFHEKPTYDLALDYVEAGNFLWNSGIFLWKKGHFLEQMEKFAPSVLRPFRELLDRNLASLHSSLHAIYERVPSISIDYALMEKASPIYVVPATFEWSDVGNWRSLEEMGVPSSEWSAVVDAENVFVRATKPTLVIGVSDVVVVETEHGVLVADKKDLERVREGIKQLRERGYL